MQKVLSDSFLSLENTFFFNFPYAVLENINLMQTVSLLICFLF